MIDRARCGVMRRLVQVALVALVAAVPSYARAQSGVAAPVIIVETSRGTFSFETFPDEAPVTVAHVVALVRSAASMTDSAFIERCRDS